MNDTTTLRIREHFTCESDLATTLFLLSYAEKSGKGRKGVVVLFRE